jgi:lysophospholipase L1-like esterase
MARSGGTVGTTPHFFRTMRARLPAVIAAVFVSAGITGAAGKSDFMSIPAAAVRQVGTIAVEAVTPGAMILAHEPDASAGTMVEFDLSGVPQDMTPLARLQLGTVEKVKVTRPGQSPGGERAALHAFVRRVSGAEPELVGTVPVKPAGIPTLYTIDVTRAVNAALRQPRDRRTLQFEVRIVGKPLPYEVYSLSATGVALEIASPTGWTDDRERRLAPIMDGPIVYREPCLPLTEEKGRELVLRLLFPARRILEVIANASGEKLEPGRDWKLRDGKLVLPPGSRAAVQFAPDFFSVAQKAKDGSSRIVRSQIRIMEGTWYHERQIEVSYEPAWRDFAFPPPRSTLDDLPRTKALLAESKPLTLIVFGDSISAGANASKLTGAWPYQPDYGELVWRQLEQHYGNKITYMNHSRGGGTSGHAATQADAQVAWFRPDLVLLAFGMNERGEDRRVMHRTNLEKIIDIIRARAPDTEFVIITPMLNNPKQPTGIAPVQFVRDEALNVARPGIAFVDLTTTHLDMIKRKDYLDLSGNGVNHPNDFLMRIYAQRVLEVLCPRK